MEAKSTCQQNGGGGPSRHKPVEKQRTDEELALIYAAMMEELGIGRKDTLPLEDKGPKVNIKPIKKPIDDDPNDPTAKWRNIQFDDVDPAEAELDSMYDGQLYRLRRGTSSNKHQTFSTRSSQSPGRGRGAGASRGGHSFTTGRGGSSRGGHGPGHKGPRTNPPSATPHRFTPTPKIFFNDARRGVNNHARIDAAIARLRALPTPETIAAQKEEEEQTRQLAAKASSSRRPQAPAAMHTCTLARPDAFLAYARFNVPAPTKPTPPNTVTQEPSLPPSPSVTSREGHEAPLGPAKVRLPQASRSAGNADLEVQPHILRNDEEKPSLTSKEDQPPTLQKGEVGLAGSRWASTTDPVAFVARTPSMTATPPSPPPPQLPAKTLAVSGRSVLREHTVKFTKGHGGFTRGTARLVKNNPEDRFFTIELEIDGKLVLTSEVLDHDEWKCDNTVVTYRAKRVEDGSQPMLSMTWSIKFQMPYQALSFYNLVICNLSTRKNRPQSNREAQPSMNPLIAAPNHPRTPVEKSEPDTSSSARTSSHLICDQIQVRNVPEALYLNAPEHPPVFNLGVRPSQHATSASNGSLPTNAASTAESGRKSILNSDPTPQQESIMPSSSPQRIPSQDWPFQPISGPSSDGLLDHYQPGATHRISSQSLTDMKEVAGFEPLLSFGNDEPEPEPKPVPDFVQAFLDLDDTGLVQTTFELLDTKPEGSFLDQLSKFVAKDTIPPTSQLTGAEILSSPKYQEAAENLVGSRLCFSETFCMLPDLISIHYITEKSRKILKKAVDLREEQMAMENSVASQSSDDINEPATRQNDSQPRPGTIDDYRLEHPSTTYTTDNFKVIPSRLTYSAQNLLSLRQGAAKFRSELISNEVAHHIVRLPVIKPPNPAKIIGKTKNGLPIVAGGSDVARQSNRGSVGGPNFKLTTTAGIWQAYSLAQPSGKPTTPTETPHNVPTLNQRSKNQVNAVPTQTPAVQEGPSSNSSGTSGPVKNELVMFPEKLPNASHTQETDMALWGALLTSVRDREQEPFRIRGLSNNSKPPAPQVPSGGLHLSTESKDQSPTPELQLIAGSEVYQADSQPPNKKQPQTASSLALHERIQKALRLPLAMSPRPKPATATAQPLLPSETPAVTNSIKSNARDAIQSTPAFSSAKPESAPEVKIEDSNTVQISPEVRPMTFPPPIQSSRPEPSIKVESPETKFSSAVHQFGGMAQAARPKTEIESKNVNETGSRPTQVPVSEKPQPVASIAKAEKLQTSETVSTSPQIPGETLPSLENVSNKDLKGVPGLAASKWASGAVNQEFIPRAYSSGGRPPTMSPMSTFKPIVPIYGPYNHAYTSQLTVGNVLTSPPPIHPMMASTPSVLQTVLVPDPLRPGHFLEITGIPASQGPPLIPMMSPPRKQENIPYALPTSPVSNFAPRPDINRGHKSNSSSGSDLNFTPNTLFKSPRGRGNSASTPQPRATLSPVRQGENVQAKLQSRLNNSLADRSPNARG